MVPATGTNSAYPIVNGVLDLSINNNVGGVSSGTVEDYVDTALSGINLGSNHHQIMYVLPQSVNFNGAAAYAYVNGGKSVYWNTYSSTLLVLVHEMGTSRTSVWRVCFCARPNHCICLIAVSFLTPGHNLGQLHSGEGSAHCKLCF